MNIELGYMVFSSIEKTQLHFFFAPKYYHKNILPGIKYNIQNTEPAT